MISRRLGKFAVALGLLLCGCSYVKGVQAQSWHPTSRLLDSLRRIAYGDAECSERVQASEKLANCYYVDNDTANLLASLSHFESVAQICDDEKNYLYARMWRLAAYYNFSMRDSFFTESSDALRLFTRHGHERYRYEVFRLRVQYYLFSNEFQYALQEAHRLVNLAQEEKSSYGLGMSHFCLAFVFQMQYAYEMAATHYREALSYLKRANPKNVEMRLHCFYQLADCYASVGNLNRLDSANRLWREEYKRHGIDTRDTSEGNPWQLSLERFYLSQARYWMGRDSLALAHSALDTAARFMQGVVGGELSLLMEKEAWFYRAGLFDSALVINDRLLGMNSDGDVAHSRFDHKQVRAQLLLALGNFEAAARLYDTLLIERNAIFKASTMQASMELSAILEAERQQLDAVKSKSYRVLGGVVLFFSIAFSIVLLHKNRQAFRKNRLLVEKVERLAILHDTIDELQQLQGLHCIESKESELYERLESIMRDNHPYLDSKLNRESLARELGTNSTYLASAIKANRPGMTVGKYIMEWRVAYAVHLLRAGSMPINEIAVKSGFMSRGTMNRAFNESYGMSPTEFREALRSNKSFGAQPLESSLGHSRFVE